MALFLYMHDESKHSCSAMFSEETCCVENVFCRGIKLDRVLINNQQAVKKTHELFSHYNLQVLKTSG